jgi:5-methyltetrahydrofolate--homocysteine methyltransferase
MLINRSIMRKKEFLDKISDVVANLEFGVLSGLIKEALDAGVNPYTLVTDGMSKGIEVVSQRFSDNEYFLSELLAAGAIMREGMEVLRPHLEAGEVKSIGKVILGTVAGDVHDIGKDIAGMLFTAAGFRVYDIGVDVPAEKFCEKVKEVDADIVAMSAMLTVTMPEMEIVIEELKKSGLRGKVKVIIGGAPVTEEFGKEIGADYAAEDAAEAVRLSKRWMEGS